MVDRMADKEKLSALMDGELIDKSLIGELSADHEGLETWHRYHLIGDVMRGETPQGEWDIAERVAFDLENEPAHGQFGLTEVQQHSQDQPLESQPSPTKTARWPAWLNSFGQVAIAACVTLVVVFSVQQYGGSNAQKGDTQLPVLQTVPLAGSAEPVSLTRQSIERRPTETNVQEQRRRINAMLQDYELQLRLNSEASSHHSGGHQELVVE
jgi:sigma-E factor negative regulatory protein RseA